MVIKSFHGHTLLSMSSDKIQDTRPITSSSHVFTNPESTKTGFQPREVSMVPKVPMATKVPIATKAPMVTKVPMATKRSLAVLASYEIWACFYLF